MLYILLPVYGRLNDTIEFIKCCETQTYRDFTLIIIDHEANHKTFETINGMHQRIHIIKGDDNLWWTGAINLGLDFVLNIGNEEDYVMTINNDVRFDDAFFEKVINTALSYKNAIFNPISVCDKQKKTVCATGTKVISWVFALNKKPFHGKPLETAQQAGIISVDYLNGRGTTIPLSTFQNLGVYNEKKLPHYGADEEFTLRAKRKGYKLFIDPQIEIYVDRSKTGLNPSSRRLSIEEIVKSFGSIKSTNNLKKLYRFTLCCVPTYAIPSYIMISFLKRLLFSSLSILCNKPAREIWF